MKSPRGGIVERYRNSTEPSTNSARSSLDAILLKTSDAAFIIKHHNRILIDRSRDAIKRFFHILNRIFQRARTFLDSSHTILNVAELSFNLIKSTLNFCKTNLDGFSQILDSTHHIRNGCIFVLLGFCHLLHAEYITTSPSSPYRPKTPSYFLIRFRTLTNDVSNAFSHSIPVCHQN